MNRISGALSKVTFGKRSFGLLALCVAAAVASSAQINTLVNFDSTNGGGPTGALVQGTDGNLYGTTSVGGTHNGGTVFKMTQDGTLTTLYNFCSQTNCKDGANSVLAQPALVQGTDGNLYGTTFGGGVTDLCTGCGTVFRITPGGKLTTLYSFCSEANCADGIRPTAGLVLASNGNFYGVTNQGTTTGYGTVFKITPAGQLTTLYTFCSQTDCADGGNPMGALVQGTDGNLYGTTWTGGPDCASQGLCGTFFRITPGGQLTTLATVAGYPSGALVQGVDGDFYGTTARAGSVFKVTPQGALTTLGFVCCYPYAGLVQGSDGNFYGTTYVGGNNNNGTCQNNGCGSVFEITPEGVITTLYSFCSQLNCTDGWAPFGPVTQATSGSLYGTTIAGGAYSNCYFGGCGTIFSLGVGLGSFVELRPAFGKVGTIVTILGNNLKGTSAVSFNGTAAAFLVGSSAGLTTITAKVPVGATSGTVKVVTPGGTLLSNVPFQVQN